MGAFRYWDEEYFRSNDLDRALELCMAFSQTIPQMEEKVDTGDGSYGFLIIA